MSRGAAGAALGWGGILRLGLVQAMLGAVVVLVTVTMNRVMVVELGLPALLPAALVALHYAVQVIRPAMGHGSDQGGRRTGWIVGGMVLLGAGALLAAQAIGLLGGSARAAGIALALLAYAVIGIGVGTSGTALLALLSAQVAPSRRPAAASTVWIMMIAGIAVTAGLSGQALRPFSLHRLTLVTGGVAGLAVLVTLLATAGLERDGAVPAEAVARVSLATALRQVWRDRQARRFTGFVAISMLAYSAEEILLEPFAGAVFAMAPGQSAQLTGLQHGGALLGMLAVAVGAGRGLAPSLRHWTLGGCAASALALALLAVSGLIHAPLLLLAAAAGLGLGNGVFAVAAIGAMMQMAGARRGGVRIGLWGAAQALAFAAGGLGGAGAIQAARAVLPLPAQAYAVVLVIEAGLFLLAAIQAARVFGIEPAGRPVTLPGGMIGDSP